MSTKCPFGPWTRLHALRRSESKKPILLFACVVCSARDRRTRRSVFNSEEEGDVGEVSFFPLHWRSGEVSAGDGTATALFVTRIRPRARGHSQETVALLGHVGSPRPGYRGIETKTKRAKHLYRHATTALVRLSCCCCFPCLPTRVRKRCAGCVSVVERLARNTNKKSGWPPELCVEECSLPHVRHAQRDRSTDIPEGRRQGPALKSANPPRTST